MHPAYERWRYNVTSSLIGWVQIQNDPCIANYLSFFIAGENSKTEQNPNELHIVHMTVTIKYNTMSCILCMWK